MPLRDPSLTAQQIARELGRPSSHLESLPAGTSPVFSLGDGSLLKLFSPEHAAAMDLEQRVLTHLRDRAPFEIPTVLASGCEAGWGFLLMTELMGQPLHTVRRAMRPAHRRSVAYQLGKALSALHRISVTGLELEPAGWRGFVQKQLAELPRRDWTLDEARARLLRERLDQLQPTLHLGHAAILSADITPAHVVVRATDAGWTLVGLVDFDEAMIGPGHYDLAMMAAELADDPQSVTALLQGYGLECADLSEELQALVLINPFVELEPGSQLTARLLSEC